MLPGSLADRYDGAPAPRPRAPGRGTVRATGHLIRPCSKAAGSSGQEAFAVFMLITNSNVRWAFYCSHRGSAGRSVYRRSLVRDLPRVRLGWHTSMTRAISPGTHGQARLRTVTRPRRASTRTLVGAFGLAHAGVKTDRVVRGAPPLARAASCSMHFRNNLAGPGLRARGQRRLRHAARPRFGQRGLFMSYGGMSDCTTCAPTWTARASADLTVSSPPSLSS